jgi:hypothetical protein
MNSKMGGIAAAFGFVLSLIIGLMFGNGAFAVVRALVFAAFFFVLVNVLIVIIGRFLPELLDFDPDPDGDSRPGSRINIIEGAGTILGDKAGLESLGSRQDHDDKSGGSPAEPNLNRERFLYHDGTGGDQDVVDSILSGMDNAPLPGPGSLSDLGGDPPGAVSPPVPALDQRDEDRYNEKRIVPELGAELREGQTGGAKLSPREDAAFPGDSPSGDVLPDFEAMSQAFLASTRDSGTAETADKPASQPEDVFRLSVAGQEPDPSLGYYTGSKPVEMEGDFPPKQLAQAIQTVLKREDQ